MSNPLIFVIAGDEQVLDGDSFRVTEEFLKEFVLPEKLTTNLSMLVAILVGLEGCQKKDVIKHI